MKFLKTRIENFLTIGDSGWLALDGKGLVLVQGANEDDSSATSNGAGKSSIPDGICWNLYGITARGESGDAVVNDKAKKNARVVSVIQDGGSIYEIARHRKHKDFKNATTVKVWNPAGGYPIENPVDMTRGTEKETQELIEQIIGCTYEVFAASIYAGQEAMPDLPKMTDKQLKLIVEQAAGVDRLEGAYKLASAKENDLKQQVTVAQTQLDRTNAAKASALANQHTVEQNHAQFEATRPDRAQQFKDQAALQEKGMRQAVADFTALNVKALAEEQGTIAAQLTSHNALLNEHRRLVGEANAAQTAFDRAAYDASLVERDIRSIAAQIQDAPNAMAKPCAECGKPHTADELEQFKAHLTQRARDKATEHARLKTAVDTAHTALQTARQQADAYGATIPDVSALAARNTELSRQIQQGNVLANSAKQAKIQYDNLLKQATICMTEVNPHQSGMEAWKSQIAQCDKDIETLTAKVTALQGDLDIAACVTKVYSPAGVRAHILDTVTPFLNDRTSDYLNALSDGNVSAVWSTLANTAKGELREKFNIEVEHAKGGKSFGLLSGGEKRKVRLACMLALQDLVASRATKPIELYLADEIDDALDSPGIERLMGILEGKARERGTVIVISHNSLNDWIDQTVLVTKRDGISHVEGALSVAA